MSATCWPPSAFSSSTSSHQVMVVVNLITVLQIGKGCNQCFCYCLAFFIFVYSASNNNNGRTDGQTGSLLGGCLAGCCRLGCKMHCSFIPILPPCYLFPLHSFAHQIQFLFIVIFFSFRSVPSVRFICL